MQCQLTEIVTAAPGDGARAAVSTLFLVIACRGFRAQRFYLNLLPVLGFFYIIRQILTSPTSLRHQFF